MNLFLEVRVPNQEVRIFCETELAAPYNGYQDWTFKKSRVSPSQKKRAYFHVGYVKTKNAYLHAYLLLIFYQRQFKLQLV